MPRPPERGGEITSEMLALYARGREILRVGDQEQWEDEGGRRREYLDICKRLDWELFHRVGMYSIFDDFSSETYSDGARRDTSELHGWHSGRELQAALEAALADGRAR
jgi:hypothetical protein